MSSRYHRLFFLSVSLISVATNIRSEIVHIKNTQDYQKKVVNASSPVIVEFSADWCSVCKGVSRPFTEVAKEVEFKNITFAQVDIDELESISTEHGIVGVPTFVYIQNGQKKDEEVGVQNMSTFKDHFRNSIRKTFKMAQAQAPTVTDTAPEMHAEQAPEMMEEKVENMAQEAAEMTPEKSEQEPQKEEAIPSDGGMNFLQPIITLLQKIIQALQNLVSAILNAIGSIFGK